MKMKFFATVCLLPLFLLAACSSGDSGSGDSNPQGATSAEDDAKQKVKSSTANSSKCDKATDRLPASKLEWQPTFAGGCEVAQQFELADLQTFDGNLAILGFEKKALSEESYKYVVEDCDLVTQQVFRDTLTFVYSMGVFSGKFNSEARPFTDAEKVRQKLFDVYQVLIKEEAMGNPPMSFVTSKIVDLTDNSDQLNMSGKMVYTIATFKDKLGATGWACSVKDVSRNMVKCEQQYEGVTYYFTYYITNPESATQRKLSGVFSMKPAQNPL